MVVGVSTGNGFRSTISYVHKEHEKDLPKDKKPEVIEKNLVFGNTPEMARQMRFVSNGNSRMSKPVMHVSVSFDAKERISEEQRQKAVQSVLKEMGVKAQDHQYLIVKHNDTANPHYHIVLNKVDLDGKKLNLGFDGKKEEFIKNRLQVIADKIEQEQGLQRTQGRNIIYDANSEKGYRFLSKEEKSEQKARNKKENREKNPNKREQQAVIKNEVAKVLQENKITTPDQFKQALAGKGVDVRFAENKSGIYGVSFKTDRISVKASQIGVKWGDISNALQENSREVQETKSITREEVERHLRADLQKVVSLCESSGYGANIDHYLKLKGLERTAQGYTYTVNDVHLMIKSDLEKGIRNTISESKALQTKYEERKAYEEKVRNAKPMDIKPVPFLFGSKIKEENAKAEEYNTKLERAKQKIEQNPVKEPNQERKKLFGNYIENALKSKIIIDNRIEKQEREFNRFEQMKAQREEKERNQAQERPRGYRR